MVELKALLFDVDGTLADTERWGHRVAFNAAFAEAGLNWVWDEALYGKLLAVSGGKERIGFYLDRYNPPFPAPAERAEFIAGLHAAKTAHFQKLLAAGRIPLRPGVRRLLAEARRAGLRLAIATTTAPENVSALLENLPGEPLRSWFEVIAAGDMVPAKKPAPDIYRLALQRLNLEPRECLAFEDSRNGLRAAMGANISACVITVNGYTGGEDFNGASLVVDHLGDPESPCRRIAGPIWGHQWVDMALLSRLHGAVSTPGGIGCPAAALPADEVTQLKHGEID